MLVRYWQWTSAPSSPASTGLPFGPLRYRTWTDGSSVPAPSAVTGLCFGPLRFRAWTTGTGEQSSSSGGWESSVDYWFRKPRFKPAKPLEIEERAESEDRTAALLAQVEEAQERIARLESVRIPDPLPPLFYHDDSEERAARAAYEQMLRRQLAEVTQALAQIDALLEARRQDDELLILAALAAVH